MKLSINGIKEQEAWKKAGIALPGYDVEAASENAKENPVWSSGSWDYLCGNL